jgi:hypothetical protein
MFHVEKDAQGCSIINIRAGHFLLRKDGILVGKPTPLDVQMADAIEMVAAMRRLVPGDEMRVLLDQRNVSRKIYPDARTYLIANSNRFSRLSILVGSALSRFFASGIIAATSLGSKARAFDNEPAALGWLQQVTPPTAASARR